MAESKQQLNLPPLSEVGKPFPDQQGWGAPPARGGARATDQPDSPASAHEQRPCPVCGIQLRPVAFVWHGAPRYRWPVCACREADVAAFEERQRARAAQAVRHLDEGLLDDGLATLVAQGMTLERFRPDWLAEERDGSHVYQRALDWLAQSLPRERASYCDPDSPPAALLCTSPTRGCGKTHLAVALGLEARRQGRRVAFVEEGQLLRRYWGCRLEEQPRLLRLLTERAWLAIIDDLGRRSVRRDAVGAGSTVADVWDALLGRRHELGGWTIITSNATPDELLARGTINASTYSRLAQMTGRQYLFFDGVDRRLFPDGSAV